MQKEDLKKKEKNENENINNSSNKQIDNYIIYIKTFNDNIKYLQQYYNTHISPKEKFSKEKINLYFTQISSTIKLLSEEKDKIISKYDSILRKNEQKIRILYSDIFNLKIKNNFLENNNEILLKKEKEYRLVKEKTGVIVENGKIVYNDRKDNEIFILRTENSTLKNVISKNEKEIKILNNKYKIEKENYEKQISNLNSNINHLKYKLKHGNPNTKGKSCSCININTNDTTNPNLKLNFTINNSLNKGNYSNAVINGVNNSNNNETNNNTNNNNSKKKKYDSILLNKNEKSRGKNKINSDGKFFALANCKSSGHLKLKNNIIINTKNLNLEEAPNTQNKELNLSNVNVSPIHRKNIACLTPQNNEEQCLNLQIFQKISDIKNNKLKLVQKNSYMMKNCFSNQNINKSNNNINGVKVIFKNSKNKSTKNNKNVIKRKQRIKKELTWSQNILMNNSVMTNTSLKINKIKVKSKARNNINKTNLIKSPRYVVENNKRKRNLITKIVGNEHSITNKTSLTSIRRKNTLNTSINSYGKNIISSPRNKIQ